jgi:hypothetical protein
VISSSTTEPKSSESSSAHLTENSETTSLLKGTSEQKNGIQLVEKKNALKPEEKEAIPKTSLTSRSTHSLSSFSSHSGTHPSVASHAPRSIPSANMLSSWQRRGNVHTIPSGKDLSHQRHLIWLGEETTIPLAMLRRSLHSRHQHPSIQSSNATSKSNSKQTPKHGNSQKSVSISFTEAKTQDQTRCETSNTAHKRNDSEPLGTQDIRPLSEILKPMQLEYDFDTFICPQCHLSSPLLISEQRTIQELINQDKRSKDLILRNTSSPNNGVNSKSEPLRSQNHIPSFLFSLTHSITNEEFLHYTEANDCFLKSITNVCNACARSTKCTTI